VIKYPKTLGACIDLAYKMRSERLELDKEVEKLKEEEAALKQHIMNSFDKVNIDGARGKVATASLSPRTVAQVEDWEALQKYIKKTGAFDLLQRRVNDAAFRERLDAKKTVPGVVPFVITTLSLTKASK
jgi:hypothetical protein